MDAQGTRSAKSIRARLEDEDEKHVNRHFGFGHQVAGRPRQKRPRKSKVLRKINERKWHGPHTQLNLQKDEIKEQKKNNV